MILILNNIETAMNGNRLGSMTPESVKAAVAAVLTDLYVLAGYDPQLTDQVDDLAKDLRNCFRHLTVEEVRLAGKAGIAGELGDIRRPSYAARSDNAVGRGIRPQRTSGRCSQDNRQPSEGT